MTEWKRIPSFPEYDASSGGEIRRLRWLLTPRSNGRGYMRVTLCTNNRPVTKYVHRLVCEAFHGPCPPEHECRHLDGTRDNNAPENLRWATKRANESDKLPHGTLQHGSKVFGAILTEVVVSDARRRAALGEDYRALADEYEVPRVTLREAINGRRWRHVIDVAPVPVDARKKLTETQVAAILALRGTGIFQREIAAMFGVEQTTISLIWRTRGALDGAAKAVGGK